MYAHASSLIWGGREHVAVPKKVRLSRPTGTTWILSTQSFDGLVGVEQPTRSSTRLAAAVALEVMIAFGSPCERDAMQDHDQRADVTRRQTK
jgi:hypothetical protein